MYDMNILNIDESAVFLGSNSKGLITRKNLYCELMVKFMCKENE